MMASRVTPTTEEEGVEVEGVEEEGGTTKAAGLVIFTRGHFGRSWALLHQTEPVHMTPMMVKRGEREE